MKKLGEPLAPLHAAGRSRRHFLGRSVCAALVAMTGPALARAATAEFAASSGDIDDGSGWANPPWLAVPSSVRQTLYQASEVRRAAIEGALLPLSNIAPLPLALLLRAGPEQPITAVYVVGHPLSIRGATTIAMPSRWRLGLLQAVTAGPLLQALADAWTMPTPYGRPTIEGVPCWGVVVKDGSDYGLPGDNWYGSAVWYHEYVHGIQPWAPDAPEGWNAWDMLLKFPADNTPLIALAYLEQQVLNAPMSTREDALHALRSFLVIRERRRALYPDYVTCSEVREVSEGVANYVEGRYLAYTGHVATSPATGKPFLFPPPIPGDTTWWKNYFAGEIAYAGSAMLFALDRYVGDRWKADYCRQGRGEPGISLPDLVRRYIAQPEGEQANDLFAQAATQFDLADIERRIAAADLPNQSMNPGNALTTSS